MSWPDPITLRPLMEMNADLDPKFYGETRFGELRVFWVKKGDFTFMPESGFEGTSGELVGGSSDWTIRSVDKYTMDLDVRGLLKVTAPEPAYIHIFYQGTVAFDDETIATLIAKQKCPYETSSFMTQPRFQTIVNTAVGNAVPDRYARLDTIVAVAHGELDGDTLRYRIYEAVNTRASPQQVPPRPIIP